MQRLCSHTNERKDNNISQFSQMICVTIVVSGPSCAIITNFPHNSVIFLKKTRLNLVVCSKNGAVCALLAGAKRLLLFNEKYCMLLLNTHYYIIT